MDRCGFAKRRVLEIYLNIAEWGPDGQFGIAEGAAFAFGKSPRDLTAREAGLLAAILPNPITRSARLPSPSVRSWVEPMLRGLRR